MIISRCIELFNDRRANKNNQNNRFFLSINENPYPAVFLNIFLIYCTCCISKSHISDCHRYASYSVLTGLGSFANAAFNVCQAKCRAFHSHRKFRHTAKHQLIYQYLLPALCPLSPIDENAQIILQFL